MKYKNGYLLAAMVGVVAAQLPSIASAAVSWNFNTTNCASTVGGNCSSDSFSDTRSYQGAGTGAVNVTVSGWANTANSDTKLGMGKITHYGSSGLGVRNADYNNGDTNEGASPEHAVDNDQRYDLVLFDFGVGNSVSLTNIHMGWVSGDADINLLAYTGGGVPTLGGVVFTSTQEGLVGTGVAGSGWTHVGDYDLSPSGAQPGPAVNPDPAGPAERVASRYWIVAAHNNVFGTSCMYDNNGCPNNNDHFKISSVTGTLVPRQPPSGGVPVPAPLALMGLGLIGVALRNKRK